MNDYVNICSSTYVIEVLWGQRIKLIQVASNSAVRCFLKIEIFGGHEVLKLYFKCSKISKSWNIRAPKKPFFNKELKFLVKNFQT